MSEVTPRFRPDRRKLESLVDLLLIAAGLLIVGFALGLGMKWLSQ